jgi:hydrogenase expression/formation protein HypE
MREPWPAVFPACPLPRGPREVQLGHGGGGELMRQLIEQVFAANLRDPELDTERDGAALALGGAPLAFTTDCYVVSPLEFPGGDIGALAVYGTVNDLAMCGARPSHLSAGFILEEGLPLETLARIVASMGAAARRAGIHVVTGDTKVVDRGKGDGLYITTAGIGLRSSADPGPRSVRAGDVVLASGDLGRHGMAILAVREGLALRSEIESDCAPVAASVQALLDAGVRVRCLRDPTRGGLASAVVEIARAGALDVQLDERAIPVRDDVRAACEILGLDPLYLPSEGRFLAFVAPGDADRALAMLQREEPAAARIGEVRGAYASGRVELRTGLGTTRLLDLLSGTQLPRIC